MEFSRLLARNSGLILARLMSSKGPKSSVAMAGEGPVLRENSAEFSMDGGKFQCDLHFNKSGDRTVEEEPMIVEMARAKAFNDSVNNVAIVNLEADQVQS